MTYKLIIFDMGNTLLDFHNGIHTDEEKDLIGTEYISNYMKREYSINVSSSTVKSELIDKWYSDFYKRKTLIELNVNEYISDFLNTIGEGNLVINSLDLMTAFYKPYMDEVIINIGAIQALTELHGKIKIGVISNCILFDEIFEQVFNKTGLGQYIDKFVFSYSRQIRKPDKRLFNEMLEYFAVLPQESIMVGDSLIADISPSKDLGMKTILYCNEDIKSKIVDFTVQNLGEVPSIIKRLQSKLSV